jgi:hypothetical protein
LAALIDLQERLKEYVPFRLTADLSRLSDNERQLVPLLQEAAAAMETPFWIQNYGDPDPLLAAIKDADLRRYVQENYGPWDKLHRDEPILAGVGRKPPGANFYPADITREEFETAAAENPELKSPFTMVRRDNQDNLRAIPYHQYFQEHVQIAAEKLRQAAELAELPSLKRFLALRAEALLTDNYRASDMAWMEMRDNALDLLIGPMEIEDRLFGIKTAYAATILIKERESGPKLGQYIELLPRFQENLLVPAAYKQERPGLDSDLQVYEALHFAGLDAVDKPQGVAWPDDEEVQLRKGMRSLLLKNMIQVKFETLMLPIADLFITGEQRPSVRQEAHFNFVMFHELAHGLGPKHTSDGQRTVQEALGNLGHAIEEGKADLLSLFIANQLSHWGELSEADLRAIYVSSLVSLLDNSEGRQAIMRLNYFKEKGAYARDSGTGTYRVNMEQLPAAIESLAEKLLRFQGDGDYEGAAEFLERYGRPDEALQDDIRRMNTASLPVALLLER